MAIKKNIFKRVFDAITGPSMETLVAEQVKQELHKAQAGDVVRFSPQSSSLTMPGGGTQKTSSLGVSFSVLRNFADYYPIARAAIEYRKTLITHLEWAIAPIEITDKTVQDKQNIANAKTIKELFKYPTGKKTVNFTNWLKQMLEDLLVIDAVALYRRRNRRGDIIGYLPVDGASIELILDNDGTTPDAPKPAYIQRINGAKIADLTTDDLIYAMMTPKTYTAYGFAPLETLIITVTTALKLQSFNLGFLCYDEKTEILTKKGWKFFYNLDDNDMVATRTNKEEFEWQKPLEKNYYDYNDKLIRFKSQTIDLLVTPNHRMLVDYRGSYGKFTQKNLIKRADWFVDNPRSETQNYLAPTTSSWIGEDPEYFELTAYTVVRNGFFSGYAFEGRDRNNLPIRSKKKFITEQKTTQYNKPSIKIPIKDWVAFLGLYLAEGWVRKENSQSRHDVYIAQSETSRHWQNIKELLDRLPFKFTWQKRRQLFECSNAVLWQYLVQFGHSYDKFIPEEIKNYSSELLEILWTWGLKGDGHISGKNYIYSTVSKKLADDYQEILQKIGREARISVYYQELGRIIRNGQQPIKTTIPIYRIFERTSTHRSLYNVTKEEYQGKVYCVKVPNGIVYVRRNGMPLWCGNSEGNVPEGFVTLPRDIASSRDQLKEWQDAWDAMLSGDPRFQRKLKFLPEGMKYEPTIKAEDMTFERFEKWLLQVTASVFGVDPTALGFNFDVNRATADRAADNTRERAQYPTSLFFKELMDNIIQEDLGHPELQFVWTNINPTDKKEEAQTATTLVNGGLIAVDEWRLAEGLKPVGVKDPFILTPVGPIFLKDLVSQSEAGQQPVAPYQPTGGKPANVNTNNLPIPSQAKSDPPSARQGLSADFFPELKKWKTSAINDFKADKPFRRFKSDIIDLRTQNLIMDGLKTVKTREDISKVFDVFLGESYRTSKALLGLYADINQSGQSAAPAV